MDKPYNIGATVIISRAGDPDHLSVATVIAHECSSSAGDEYLLRFMDGEEGGYLHDELAFVTDDPIVSDGKPYFWTLDTAAKVQRRTLARRESLAGQRESARLGLYVAAKYAVEAYLNGDPRLGGDIMGRLADAVKAWERAEVRL